MSKVIIIVFFVSVAGLLLFGCGDDDGGAATVDVTGTWHGINLEEDVTGTMSLEQTGNSVSGTFVADGIHGTVVGSVSGNQVTLTFTSGAERVDFEGTVSDNTMSGSWHYIPTGETGAFTATR